MTVSFVKATWAHSIITRLSRTVSRTPIIKTVDAVTGDETLTEGATENISGVFHRYSQKWVHDKGGRLETGDAYLAVKDSVNINNNDIIMVDNKKYRVADVITRYTDNNNSTAVMKFAKLFLYE